jgi:hypothetical protein
MNAVASRGEEGIPALAGVRPSGRCPGWPTGQEQRPEGRTPASCDDRITSAQAGRTGDLPLEVILLSTGADYHVSWTRCPSGRTTWIGRRLEAPGT